MLQYLVFVGAAVQLLGVLDYIKDTIKGKVKPNKVTWLLWATAPLIASAAAISDGVTLATVPVFMAGFAPLLVFIASFINKESYWELTRFDYLCGIFSILALVLWWITGDAIVAIIFALISDGLASLPTIVKSWKFPETESISPYITGLFNALTSFFALKTFSITELAFPIYLVILSIVLLITIYLGRLRQNNT